MDETNFQENKESIIQKVKKKAINLQCPVCSNQNMMIADGYFAHDIQNSLKSRTLGGQNVPVIPIICSNCGLIREFAAGVYGLIPMIKEDEKK